MLPENGSIRMQLNPLHHFVAMRRPDVEEKRAASVVWHDWRNGPVPWTGPTATEVYLHPIGPDDLVRASKMM
jgi:hypothetical protein